MNHKINKKFKKGFSFLEVMLAVFVLSVGLLSILALIASSIRHSIDSRDRIIATELAQEGIELIRNKRDTNLANGKDAFAADDPDSGEMEGYFPYFAQFYLHKMIVDYDGTIDNWITHVLIEASERYILRYNSSNLKYTTDATNNLPKTKFARKIIIDDYPEPEGENKKVTSIVAWGGATQRWFNPAQRDDGYVPELASDCLISKRCVYSEAVITGR